MWMNLNEWRLSPAMVRAIGDFDAQACDLIVDLLQLAECPITMSMH
jgi:hypothetical protein